jgi:hypothetical protein
VIPLKWIQSLTNWQVFIIDNSASMHNCWGEMTRLFDSLIHTLEQHNKDGIDMHFSSETGQQNTRFACKCLVDRHDHWRQGNESEKCSKTHGNLDKSLALRLRQYLAGRQRKKMTVLVLTDGLWADKKQASMERLLSDFDHLRRDQTGEENFSVQFIRFGNNPKALERFTRMDNIGRHVNTRYVFHLCVFGLCVSAPHTDEPFAAISSARYQLPKEQKGFLKDMQSAYKKQRLRRGKRRSW